MELVFSGIFSLFKISWSAFSSPGPSLSTAQGFLKDAEGNQYRTVTLKGVEWMAENLRTSMFKDGRKLFHATNKAEWDSAQRNDIAAWMNYKFDKQNDERFGKLYNRKAVSDSIGLAPEGWIIGSGNDFQNLLNSVSVGYVLIDGDREKEIDGENDAEFLRSEKDKWRECSRFIFPDDYGTNESGFSALPAGYYLNGIWMARHSVARWWSRNLDEAFEIGEHESVNIIKLPTDEVDLGLYVRLVKAKP